MPWWVPFVAIGGVVAYINLKDPLLAALRPRPIGSWRYVADSATKRVAWTLDMPDAMLVSLAVHVMSWRLFYVQRQLEEGVLIQGTERLLADPDDCDWTLVDSLDAGVGLSGGVLKSGLLDGYPGFIGGSGGTEARASAAVGSALVLLQKVLRGSQAQEARAATATLIAMHRDQGPAKSLDEVGVRARRALQR